ncbi:MAG: Zn-dependent hydrolase [Desulfobacteraceae bacterium]|nr:Zn-dependent hydrolase [Desulfobacteraceae bacterium]MBC2751915.1 Zn-dependent hydrolase [Desulfobacteraceae bacterium]
MTISETDLKNCFDHERMAALIESFGKIGRTNAGGVSRLAFSDEDRKAREKFLHILETEFNLAVRIDPLGNIFARREGRYPDLPVIMTGSHLDSVRNGGKFDGPAGVFSSLEAFRTLDLLDIETQHPFELCMLSSEEPNTFGISTFGSRGMVGTLKKKDVETLCDDNGQRLPDALKNIGGDLDRMAEAVRSSGEIKYFLELHIEQMPCLEEDGKDIGIVDGVTGIYREAVTVAGEASHCGTTPMTERKDALCAASEIILALEEAARQEEGQAVATVGHMTVFPNSINITPGQVTLDLEIRSFYQERISRIREKVAGVIEGLVEQRGVRIERKITYDNPPIRFSPVVVNAIAEATEVLGFSSRNEVSMAGHDAAHVNGICKAGMIFIPCRKGLSHCPEEFTTTENIVKGAQCLLKTLLLLDQG